MLIALITILFFTGGGASWQLPVLEKPIEQNVTDEAHRKAALDAHATMNKELEQYGKFAGKTGKEMLELTKNYDAKPEQFNALAAQLDSARVATLTKLLDGRFQMRAQMTADEWTKVYAAAAAAADERAKKAAAKASKP